MKPFIAVSAKRTHLNVVRCLILVVAALSGSVLPVQAEEQVRLVHNINRTPEDWWSLPSDVTRVGSTVYFTAEDDGTGRELWKSDRTIAGTTLVRDIYPGPESAFEWNYVDHPMGLASGTNSVSKQTARGPKPSTSVLQDDQECWYESAVDRRDVNCANLTALGTNLIFSAFTPLRGYELWRSDGTRNGTVLLKDIAPGEGSSWPAHFTVVGTTLYFVAQNERTGRELWKTDGTTAGTTLVFQSVVGPVGGNADLLTAVGNTLYFAVDHPTYGTELWRTAGTAATTRLVRDIYPGNIGSYPGSLKNFNGTLYFTASDSVHGSELWKSNGTAAGTLLVKDINTIKTSESGAATHDSKVSELTIHNRRLYFSADNGIHGPELYSSDGTAANTKLVADLARGAAGSYPRWLTSFGTMLLFNAERPTVGEELWRTDGTAAGTTLVKDINPGTASSQPWELRSMGGHIYFSATSPAYGDELWKTDGTTAGTVLVRDILPGSEGSFPTSLLAVGSTVIFAADGGDGDRLWRTSGTAADTWRLMKRVGTDKPSLDG